jgi:hypothetical protein
MTFSQLIPQLVAELHYGLIHFQQIAQSQHRLEHSYLIMILMVALVVSTEQLRNPKRKLRNRSDRAAWGQR